MTYSQWPRHAAFLLFAAGLAGSAMAANNSGAGASGQSSKAGHIKVSESIVIHAAPRTVWNAVRDFDAISVWHPAVETSRITSGKNNQPGAKRHLALKGGGSVDEQLISWNNHRMRYTYRILDGVLPVAHYRSTIAVKADGKQKATLIWEGRFDSDSAHTDAQARKAIEGVYRAGLLHVRTMLGAEHQDN